MKGGIVQSQALALEAAGVQQGWVCGSPKTVSLDRLGEMYETWTWLQTFSLMKNHMKDAILNRGIHRFILGRKSVFPKGQLVLVLQKATDGWENCQILQMNKAGNLFRKTE